MVVEHLRARRSAAGPGAARAGVAGEQDALGDGLVWAQVDGLWRHAREHRTRVAGAMAKDKKKDKKDKKDSKGVEADAIAAIRSAVERTLRLRRGRSVHARAHARDRRRDRARPPNKVRSTLEDMKVLDEVKSLRREVEALAAPRRVARGEPGRCDGRCRAARSPRPKKPPRASRGRKAAAKPPAPTKTPAARKRAATQAGGGEGRREQAAAQGRAEQAAARSRRPRQDGRAEQAAAAKSGRKKPAARSPRRRSRPRRSPQPEARRAKPAAPAPTPARRRSPPPLRATAAPRRPPAAKPAAGSS